MTMDRKIEHYNFIFKHFKAHFILGVYGYMVKQKTAIVPILLLDLIFTIEFSRYGCIAFNKIEVVSKFILSPLFRFRADYSSAPPLQFEVEKLLRHTKCNITAKAIFHTVK